MKILFLSTLLFAIYLENHDDLITAPMNYLGQKAIKSFEAIADSIKH
jgi:hypothetical protein